MIVLYVAAPGQANAAAREAALAAVAPTPGEALPRVQDMRLPVLVLYSPVLNQFSSYYDDGTLTQATYLADPMYAEEVTASNEATIQANAETALTTNATFLGQGAPTYPLTIAEQQALVAQVAALTHQVNGLIRLALAQFDSTAGT